MTRKMVTMMAVLIFAGSTLAFAHTAEKFTGTVSDSMCGAKHMGKDKTAAQCTRECAKDSSYALVAGDEVYTLAGDKAEFNQFAGQKVAVEGDLKGNTITVESIQVKK